MKKQNVILTIIIALVLQLQVMGQTPNLPVSCAGGKVRYGVPGKLPGSTIEWEVTGGKILSNYGDSVDIEWDQIAGIKVIKATENTGFTCASTPSYGYVMVSVPGIKFNPATAICQGQIAVLSAQDSYKDYQWSTGSTRDTIQVGKAGWYGLRVTDASGCMAKDSIYLTVNSTPVVDLGKDITLCENEQTELNAGEGSYYKWSTSENDIFRTLQVGKGKKEIWVEVTNDKGCVGRDTVNILACKSGIKIPNTFTPNGDGDNDTWGIPYLEGYTNASVEVFDRWGRLVFSARNGYPEKGWDGTSNGKPLPMDSYYYIIKRGDGSDPETGNITIIR